MVVGELFLAAVIQVLVNRLASRELLNFAVREGIGKKLETWSETLAVIQAVLDDAEDKQLTDKTVKTWLDNLRDLAYDVEDVLDEFATQALHQKLKAKGDRASTNKVRNLISGHFTGCRPSAITFKRRMGFKIKEISSRLSGISEQITKLGLEKMVGVRSASVWKKPPSSCVPNETRIYGRDGDKEKVVNLVLRDEPSDVNFHVVPIVGMGGVGKTTLAQLVYNDDDAVRQFNPKAWVCVSEEFDILRITKALVESITSLPCDLKDLNQVQVKLKEALAGKKFLIVLDDVWNKNYGEWNGLQSPFRAGAPGSKIIVTTRDVNVGLMMGAVDYHYLKHISHEDCWSVFVQHAFENKNIGDYPSLELIGRKIVKRCRGLPLAARTLGGLLRCKQRDDEWEDILNSKIWSLSDEESEILPVLRLSYHHLPSHLKRCFSYCSILPKDYEFEEEELVLLWMAEGLIQQLDEKKQMEDLGGEYFRELVSRSFFQQSSRDKTKFVMHDLISDLAQWVAGDTCFVVEDRSDGNKLKKISQKCRHSSFISGKYDGVKKFEAFSNARHLRTFLPLMPPYPGSCYLTDYVPFQLLPKLRRLRVLSLSGYSITGLPNSIGELKHLRYFNLCQTNIRSLPESTGLLYNLQTLFVRDCLQLKKLPTDLGKLINLRHLDVTNVESIEEMPLGMKELINLQTLSNFVVGKGKGSGITELKDLLFLQGRLCISRLENVTDARDAREANLNKKQDLDALLLKWDSRFDESRNERIEKDVLDMLQPHTKLKELTVKCYGGTKFPIWVGDPSFSYLVLLKLENCEKCTSLPSLGLLPSLKELIIIGMSGVKCVGSDFYGENYLKPFQSLETLRFQDMLEWEDWIPHVVANEEFPHLRELCIESCPKLTGKLPCFLPALEKLVILKCRELVVSIPSMPMLRKFEIVECKEVMHGDVVDLGSLNCMVFSTISRLSCLTEEFRQALTEVKELKISTCDGMTSLWGSDVGSRLGLVSLRQLVIEECPQLVSLVAEEEQQQLQLGWPCELELLGLRHCESLVILPQWLHSIMSLRELIIEDCPKLAVFPEAGLPSELRVIRIKNCNALAPLPSALVYNSMRLENLYIEGCDPLLSFSRSQLPPHLKRLEIISCKNLQCLLDDGESSSSIVHEEESINSCCLEYLHISECPSLLSLSSEGKLPATLKHLQINHCSKLMSLSLPSGLKHLSIEDCPKLESIADRFHNAMSLESINIFSCESFKSLPQGLHYLSHLHEISIWYCPKFISFPRGELHSTNLRELCISWCEELEALPDQFHNLPSLEELWIYDCPGIISFPEGGFSTNLTSLTIINLNICKPLFEWGLHRLSSLRDLYIEGGCPDMVSFPDEEKQMMLPPSLTSLSIIKFPNVEYLSSRGFRNLTSLERLSVSYCHKLKTFPERGFPPSLLQLYIYRCSLLNHGCNKNKGREWFKIAHIPCVRMDGRFIHDQ